MSEQPRWSKAQEQPGTVEHVWWSLVDTKAEMVRGHIYSRSLTQSLVDGLNQAVPIVDVTAKGFDPEVVQAMMEEIEQTSPRTCGHQNTGDGSAVNTCDVCMAWATAQDNLSIIRRCLGIDF